MHLQRFVPLALAGALLVSACSSSSTESASETDDTSTDSSLDASTDDTTSDDTTSDEAAPPADVDPRLLRPNDDESPFDLTGGASSGTDEDQVLTASADDLPGDVRGASNPWPTDWTRATIDYAELAAGLGGSDTRDLITPIDMPEFESPSAAAQWVGLNEPGALVQLNGEARFYPLSIMTAHEIVNDRFGDIPVAVTYCPLCNTALSFDRRIDGEVVRLGVSGLLRKSDMVMWDDATTSLWQQITGEGIAGEFAGSRLDTISTRIVSFSQFAEEFPDGWSLSQNTGFGRLYGLNPYVGYSSSDRPIPGFFPDEPDPRFPALERVVGVLSDEGDKSYPFSVLSESVVVNDSLGSTPIVVWWAPGTADALDTAEIAEGRDVGSAVAYHRTLEDRTELTFEAGPEDGTYTDAETGSTWNLFGRATAGELEGTQLSAITHRNEFWFAWAAFFPDGDVYSA